MRRERLGNRSDLLRSANWELEGVSCEDWETFACGYRDMGLPASV